MDSILSPPGHLRRPPGGVDWRRQTSTLCNLDWVRPHTLADGIAEDDLLLLADEQTSGGVLLVGEISGAPVIGELLPRAKHGLIIR